MKKDKVFYQSKFEHYRVMNMWIVIASCISSLFYVISDWHLFGEINMVTVPARTAILIPFAVFMIVNAKVKDYRAIVPLSYLIAHGIMWCTIWACAYLPDLTFASDGFIIIMAIFIFFGFAAPGKWSVIFTGLIFLDIGVANTFLHYPELLMMLILGIPFYAGICLVVWAMEKSYVYQYVAQRMLEESAYHDQLTGLFNRNIIDTLMDENKSLQCFGGEDISVLLFDIDLFKRVNDTYGHESGDVVLKEVVDIVSAHLEYPNYMLRWGGEEFLVILRSDLAGAEKQAEKIRQAIEKETGKICPVTISIGVTGYHGGDYNASVRMADEALYEAKESGRNRVKIYNSNDPTPEY